MKCNVRQKDKQFSIKCYNQIIQGGFKMKEFQIPDFDQKEEVKKCKSLDDVIQNILEAEMEELLGRKKYERNIENNNKNYRNGYSKKI